MYIPLPYTDYNYIISFHLANPVSRQPNSASPRLVEVPASLIESLDQILPILSYL